MINLSSLLERKSNQFTKNHELPYRIVIGLIACLYVVIFSIHLFSPNEGRYVATENGDLIQTEGNGTFKVINRTYDKSTKQYQVVLWLVSDANLKEDYQLEMKATSVTQSDSTTKKESEVVRVGRNYFSIVVADVPEEYEAIRTDIELKKQAIGDNQEVTGDVKLYSKESQTESSVVENSPDFFAYQEKNIQVSELDIELEKIKKETKSIQKDIEKITELQETIRQDMVIQTGEERESSEQAVQDYQVEIATKNEALALNKRHEKELEEKKNLIKSEI